MNENAEIFTYNAAEPLYAMHWSARRHKNFRLALGTFKDGNNNSLEVVELNESTGTFQFEPKLCTHHGFPATKIMFAPGDCRADLIASSSDALRLWRINNDVGLETIACLIPNQNPNYNQPLTSFDWLDPSYIGTCSIDHSCTIWNVERQTVEKQLIAHQDEVNDFTWSNVHGRFATVSSDGSLRIFDMRQVTNSTVSVVYENAATPLVRVTWNRQDARYLAAVVKDSHRVLILDIRYAGVPIAELDRHKLAVNALAWAPHSSCHICTAGDDGQALIWDLKSIKHPPDRNLEAILSYSASAEILQVQWSPGRPDWIAVCFDTMAQILRV